MDTSVNGDEFWDVVVRCCPLIEEIEMGESLEISNLNTWPIKTMTGRALLTLARLPRLASLALAAARFTAKDIVAYLQAMAKTDDIVRKERDIYIKIGGHDRSSFLLPAFYREIVELLELLAKTSEESLGLSRCHRKLVLHVQNPYESKVHYSWCGDYLSNKLIPAVEAVRSVHPTLQISVGTFGRRKLGFKRINEVTLDWHGKRVKLLFEDDPDGFEFYKRAETYEINSGNESEGRTAAANFDVPMGEYESDSDDEDYGSYSSYGSENGSKHEGSEGSGCLSSGRGVINSQ